MSFWDDDFYTTRVKETRPRRWNRTRGVGSRLGIAVIAVAVVVVIAAIAWPRTDTREAAPPSVQKPAAGPPVQGSPPPAAGGAGEDQVIHVVEQVDPAVVSVVASLQDSQPSDGASYASMSLGSGVIFYHQGNIARVVTNNHVVEGADKVEIVLLDGTKKAARIVGTDVISDLAVLEMDGSGIQHIATFGDSDQLKAGQTAIAMGNPLGLSSVSVGVISNPHQIIPVEVGQTNTSMDIDVIQTDAAINEGNSGGALVDLQGEVIGINSRKVAASGVEGLGFAIPINQAKPVIDDLIRDGKVHRAFLGVSTQDVAALPEDFPDLRLPKGLKDGVLVVALPDGPSKKAGIQEKDVIVALDDQPIKNTYELRKYLYMNKKPGDDVKVTVYRDGHLRSVHVTLGELQLDTGK